MELLIARCAGLDVHQATVVATVRVPDEQGGRRSVTETFGTMTADLFALREWLQAYGVTHIALESNRLCNVLEDAGLKLTSVVTDVMGVSGRAMLRALVEGTTDPAVLADLARGVLRKKLPELRRALQGRFRRHHAFLIEQIFAKIDFLDETLDRLTTEIEGRLGPFDPMLTSLDTIPGVDRIGAISIVAETGGDMSRFPSAGHLGSWGATGPGQNEGAGKRRSGQNRQGQRDLRGTLVQAGVCAMRQN